MRSIGVLPGALLIRNVFPINFGEIVTSGQVAIEPDRDERKMLDDLSPFRLDQFDVAPSTSSNQRDRLRILGLVFRRPPCLEQLQ